MIVTISDFVGKYQLHSGTYVTNNIQAYIDKYEPKYLRELFGAVLYTDFLSDLDQQTNEPKSPNFRYIYFPFAEDVNVYQMLVSEGIKEMLLGFIYFEYSKDLQNQMTPYGNVQNKSELSNTVSTLSSMIWTRYNESVRTFMAIRDWMLLNWDTPTGQIVGVNLLYTAPNYPNNITVFINVVNGWVTGASVDIGGTGYAVNDVLFCGNNGVKIQVLSVDNTGAILTFMFLQQGYGHYVGQGISGNGGSGNNFQMLITSVQNSKGTINGTASVNTQALSVGGVQGITLNNFGTGYVDEDNVPLVYVGSGIGASADIIADPNTGAVLQATIGTPNFSYGYSINNVLTIDQTGANFDADVIVTAVSNGELQDVILTPNVATNTVNFIVGDRIHVQGNGNTFNAVFEVTEVGIGDFTKQNGYDKQMAYWI
jgi:hypothetical protein